MIDSITPQYSSKKKKTFENLISILSNVSPKWTQLFHLLEYVLQNREYVVVVFYESWDVFSVRCTVWFNFAARRALIAYITQLDRWTKSIIKNVHTYIPWDLRSLLSDLANVLNKRMYLHLAAADIIRGVRKNLKECFVLVYLWCNCVSSEVVFAQSSLNYLKC